MPLNLLKKYNELLELAALNDFQRQKSLQGIFNRDIKDNLDFKFQHKQINPTPADGIDSMERLFAHLTTVIIDKSANKREFDLARSVRLHWLRHHLEERKKHDMYIFSVREPYGIRTYI